jgi:large subunit ribosomal protein L9
MKVLLMQDVSGLGQAGEIKKVADGYARNYLIPRGLAVLARPGMVRQAEEKRRAEDKKASRQTASAQVLAEQMAQLTLTFTAKAGEQDKLYGSITSGHIADELERQTGHPIDRRKVLLDEPIKQLGSHQVSIKLAADVVGAVTIVVEREE